MSNLNNLNWYAQNKILNEKKTKLIKSFIVKLREVNTINIPKEEQNRLNIIYSNNIYYQNNNNI